MTEQQPPGGFGAGAPVSAPPHGKLPTSSSAAPLIALGIVILLVGVLVSLAIVGVRNYIETAKTVEALNSVRQISNDAIAAFDGSEETLRPGSRGHGYRRMCPSATKPVPESASSIRGTKYMAGPKEYERDADANAGFACIKFSLESPQYYQYDYQSTRDTFDAIAHGDLDGDQNLSTYHLHGALNDRDELEAPAIIEVVNPKE